MKVVSGETMQILDRRTMDEFGVSGLTLMENAGRRCVEEIISRYGADPEPHGVIFAGKGNNGGDGFVIARLLLERGWRIRVFVLCQRDEIKGDARVNLERLRQDCVLFMSATHDLSACNEPLRLASVVIDALLGTGLKSEVTGLYAAAIRLINCCNRPVVAVDIPSGIDSASGRELGCSVQATLSVTFALAKTGHVLYPGAEACGRLKIADIGIPGELTSWAPGHDFIDTLAAASMVKKRGRTIHKGDCGHVLIIAGSTGKSGAAAMAANSAVRGGAGLVTLAAPASINTILEIKTTEAMTLPLPDEGSGQLRDSAAESIARALTGKDVVAIGPGISRQPETALLVRGLVAAVPLPLVLDADALNAVSEEPDILLRRKSAIVILTPHPGEMGRLAGISTPTVEDDRIGVASAFAARYGVYLVLKGARTIISAPDGSVAINGSGNPGMASGGMGDVLTGLLAALLAQGYEPFTACRLAVFLHGQAADMVAAEKGELGISAVDVQEKLPYAFKFLTGE